jgi:hypothetical protein
LWRLPPLRPERKLFGTLLGDLPATGTAKRRACSRSRSSKVTDPFAGSK